LGLKSVALVTSFLGKSLSKNPNRQRSRVQQRVENDKVVFLLNLTPGAFYLFS